MLRPSLDNSISKYVAAVTFLGTMNGLSTDLLLNQNQIRPYPLFNI